jgi:hypothetical protein
LRIADILIMMDDDPSRRSSRDTRQGAEANQIIHFGCRYWGLKLRH